jgi:hypothetical protein
MIKQTGRNYELKKYKLAAALAACVMVVSQLAVPNVAAAGDTIDSVQIKKYLVIKKNVTAPTVSFTYTLAPGTAIPATDTTHEIKAGPDGAVFASTGGTSMTVVFASDDALTPESSAPSGSTIQFATADTSDEAYVEKDITVDLSGVTFPAAGIYRYIITEQTPEATGITYDSVNKRYIDVFVHKYDQGEDDKYVAYTAIVKLNDGAPDTEGKADAATKSTGFTNRYATDNLSFSKEVTGNQSSFNQYFKFTVKLTGSLSTVSGDTHVKLGGVFDAKPAESMATVYDGDVMARANSIETFDDEGESIYTKRSYVTLSQLIEGKDFYLKGGQSISLTGLPTGMGYVVTEVEEDYTPSVEVTGDEDCSKNENSVTDSALTQNTNLAFINERSGIIPATGVAAAFALPVAALLAGIAGIVLLVLKRLKGSNDNATEGN